MRKWTLVETTKNYRVYKYDGFLTNFPNKSFELEYAFNYSRERLNPKYEMIFDISKGVEYVIISDAHTHIERLVFPACQFKDKETGEIKHLHLSMHKISGRHTFMIDGGNIDDVFPDEVYLRHLQILNREDKC